MGGGIGALRAARCTALAGVFWHCATWSFGGFEVDAQATVSAVAFPENAADNVAGHFRGQVTLSKVSELDVALRRHLMGSLRLDSASSHCGLEFCGDPPALDYILLLGYSHYAYGRLLLGRNRSLVADLAQASSAFGSETIGADRCLALLIRGCPALSPFSVSWDLPTYFGAWTPALQLSTKTEQITLSGRLDLQVFGGRLMAAYSGSNGGVRSLPVGLSIPLGRWRVFALRNAKQGPSEKSIYRSVGVYTPWAGGDWRFQASQYELGQEQSNTRKFSGGYHRPLNMNWVAFVDVAILEHPLSRRKRALDLGLRWTMR